MGKQQRLLEPHLQEAVNVVHHALHHLFHERRVGLERTLSDDAEALLGC